MAGVDSTGLQIKTLEEIQNEIVSDQLANISADLDTSSDQPLGQLNGIVSAKLAEVWELAQVAYNAFNRDAAEGILLDTLGDVIGVPRQSATFSTVTLSVDVDLGTVLTAGVSMANVQGQPLNRWTIINNFTAPTAGVFQLQFKAVQAGRVLANPNTITEITTSTAGWNSVNNPGIAIAGRNPESDEDYRIRQTTLLSAPGSSSVDAIRADLAALSNMQQVDVVENTTDFTNSLGLPPHSFEAIFRDNDLIPNDLIAQTIWNTKPVGIATYGITSGVAIDGIGLSRVVNFSRAIPVNLNFGATAQTLPGYNSGQQAVIAQLIADYLVTLRVGEDVVANRIRTIVMSQPFVYDVTLITINGSTSSSYVIQPREYAAMSGFSLVSIPIGVAP